MKSPRIPVGVAVAAAMCVTAGAVIAPAADSSTRKPTVKKVTVADNYFAPIKVTIKQNNDVNFVWSSQNYNTHNVTLIKGPKGVKKAKFTSIDGTTGLHFKREFTKPG